MNAKRYAIYFLAVALWACAGRADDEPGSYAEAVQPSILGCNTDYSPATSGFEFLDHAGDIQLPPETTIGQITYTKLPVFDQSDPAENNAVYRWANRFHVLTKDRTLEQQLLFKEGDTYSGQVIEETARLLRQNKYLYDAAVRPVRLCGDDVDMEVITRDVWSFAPEMSVKRSGGKSSFRFSLRDTNVFGSGKQLAVASKSDVDRDTKQFLYRDGNVFGSRIVGRLNYMDSDDGTGFTARMFLPFVSLDSRRAWSVVAEGFERDDTQYFRSDKSSEIRHESDLYQVFYGFSKGLQNGISRRWSLGYRYEQHRYSPADELPPPGQFPRDRKLSYPFLLYESIEDSYSKSYNLDQILRTEDLHTGRRITSRIGYSPIDDRRLVIDSYLTNTLAFNPKSLLQHRARLIGFWNFDRSAAEELTLSYQLRYFHNQSRKRNFFALFSAIYSKNLNTDRQLQLGGDTGLRGYPQRYATGDRSYLLSLEQRFYSDVHLLNLIRVGWAVFFDAGKAWFPGGDNGAGNRLLMNAGIGLRLFSSKAELGRVIHLDIAIPANQRSDPEVDQVQYLVTIKDSF